VLVKQSSASGDPNANPWVSEFLPDNSQVTNGNLVLSMGQTNGKGFGATVSSVRWMEYGSVTAKVKTGVTAGGVVNSFITRSSKTGNEIDFEWVGKSHNSVQTNFYWNALDLNSIDYTNGKVIPLSFDTTADFHSYTIQWDASQIVWLVDGNTIRTLPRSSLSDQSKWPTGLQQVQFSLWDGSATGAQGTIDWAGGRPPYPDGKLYYMYVGEVDIKCASPVSSNYTCATLQKSNSKTTSSSSSKPNSSDKSSPGSSDTNSDSSADDSAISVSTSDAQTMYSLSAFSLLALALMI